MQETSYDAILSGVCATDNNYTVYPKYFEGELISRFWGLSVKFLVKYYRPPYSLIHFGSGCNSAKFLFLSLLNLKI